MVTRFLVTSLALGALVLALPLASAGTAPTAAGDSGEFYCAAPINPTPCG